MVLPSIDTSTKGGQYHKPFYSRQIIKGRANRKVVMATIDLEGFLVLSSLRRGVNASEDHTNSPSIGVITTLLCFYFLLINWIITIRRPSMLLFPMP